MNAKLGKTKKSDVRWTFSELWEYADKILGEGWMYVKAPYAMSKEEFLMHYGKFYVVLPSFPSAFDLQDGILNHMGTTLVKFWKVQP